MTEIQFRSLVDMPLLSSREKTILTDTQRMWVSCKSFRTIMLMLALVVSATKGTHLLTTWGPTHYVTG